MSAQSSIGMTLLSPSWFIVSRELASIYTLHITLGAIQGLVANPCFLSFDLITTLRITDIQSSSLSVSSSHPV